MWSKLALQKKGIIFVFSGPSGSGKTTLAQAVLADKKFSGRLEKSISFTTRPRRRGEKPRKDYFFISETEFRRGQKTQKILEWTRYLGYYYGTAREFVDSRLENCRSLILCLDLKGAARIKALYPKSSVTVFIMPPSLEELARRIENRHRETNKLEIAKRLRLAKQEMACAKEFDFCVINSDLAQAVKELKGIIAKKIT
jgi:guanylate kinase